MISVNIFILTIEAWIEWATSYTALILFLNFLVSLLLLNAKIILLNFYHLTNFSKITKFNLFVWYLMQKIQYLDMYLILVEYIFFLKLLI